MATADDDTPRAIVSRGSRSDVIFRNALRIAGLQLRDHGQHDFDPGGSGHGDLHLRVRARSAAPDACRGRRPDGRAGLWEEVHRRLRSPGGALSGGQQQRLCIARSLANAPDVLLMDEPCSALDPISTNKIEETVAELSDQVTIVIVTHNMQQAHRVSDDCAFFLATHDAPGYVVESGPTQQIFENPSDPRTSDYVNGRFG